jgi:hypothetical protein
MRLTGFLLFVALAALAADDAYLRELQEFRRQQDEFMRSARSPLLLVGRSRIEEGESTIGSAAASKIVLPERAPARVGTIIRRGRELSLLAAAGTTLAVNDQPESGSIHLHTAEAPAPADRVSFGDFTFAIRPIGPDFYLLLTDKQSTFLRDFKEKSWFPADPAFRVTARLVPYEHPKTRDVTDTTGSMRTYTSPGSLLFQLGGQTLRLEPLVAGEQLLLMFQDKTSGKETYGGGRFLDVAMPKQGQTVLDFNKAYNPYCAFDPYAACPTPQKENRLPVSVLAGETHNGHGF